MEKTDSSLHLLRNDKSVTKIEHCSDIGHGQDKIPLRSSTRVGGIEQKYH